MIKTKQALNYLLSAIWLVGILNCYIYFFKDEYWANSHFLVNPKCLMAFMILFFILGGPIVWISIILLCILKIDNFIHFGFWSNNILFFALCILSIGQWYWLKNKLDTICFKKACSRKEKPL